jgi:hypothetical protein
MVSVSGAKGARLVWCCQSSDVPGTAKQSVAQSCYAAFRNSLRVRCEQTSRPDKAPWSRSPGLAIAGSCDFVVAAADARLGLPKLTVGVMGGARHLARMAPQPVVRRRYFTGEPMSAQDLAAAGARGRHRA